VARGDRKGFEDEARDVAREMKMETEMKIWR